MDRYLLDWIKEDLESRKMVFIGGPRQVGKTTFSLSFLMDNPNEDNPAYLSWDEPKVRNSLVAGELPTHQSLIIFDEIHKYPEWRNLVKGFWDRYKNKIQIIVTGSARLDFYRHSGDSLQGRYHYYRMHPLTIPELKKNIELYDFQKLLIFGGFPEPYLKGSQRFWQRWQNERSKRLFYEDIPSLEKVNEIAKMALLQTILPSKVGSPLSINNLRQDLAVSFETVERWIQILERLYACFRIAPFTMSKKLRLSKKEKKLYLWDWSLCETSGAKFENMVASHLLKYCHFIEDTQGENMELCFLKDSTGREIDFIVLKNKKPLFGVECKCGDKELSPNIAYFAERLAIPIFYQVHLGNKTVEVAKHRAMILNFETFCSEVNLV